MYFQLTCRHQVLRLQPRVVHFVEQSFDPHPAQVQENDSGNAVHFEGHIIVFGGKRRADEKAKGAPQQQYQTEGYFSKASHETQKTQVKKEPFARSPAGNDCISCAAEPNGPSEWRKMMLGAVPFRWEHGADRFGEPRNWKRCRWQCRQRAVTTWETTAPVLLASRRKRWTKNRQAT